MGFGPQVVDLDGDGCKDMISGSYWPGEIWLFRGTKDGAFEKGSPIEDEAGKPLHAGPPWKADDKPEMDSLAAAPFACDHDGDGDLDLLVGNIAGRVILIKNHGSTTKPLFGKTKEPIEAGGQPIDVPGGDAGPTVADWDRDGKADLIVGAGDGSVRWFRNTGSGARPVYASGVVLLPAGGQEKASAAGSSPERPGIRTKPYVVDYDGDGLLDLLVGDYASRKRPAPKLTRPQEDRRDELRRRRDELQREFEKLAADGKRPANDDPGFKRVREALGEVFKELSPLEEGYESHGWVWLYRRLAPPGGSRAGGSAGDSAGKPRQARL